ncbi:MAG: hypothetical protein ACI83O_000304 [Patescibacteria group bacterium]|jgi:hypothetical protein
METMKKQITFAPFVVAIALFLVGFASAAGLASGDLHTEFDSIVLSDTSDVSVSVGDTVPVRVTFTADIDATDVKLRASLEGLREDIAESTNRFDIVAGKTYTKLLNLEMPSSITIRDDTKPLTLYVEVVNANDKSENTFAITVQRESYDLSVLSVDYNTKVTAGDVFPVSVVLKNTGFNRVDDNYVVAAIPDLGISSRGYVGDLIAVEDYIDYDDEEDSANKVVYLQVPRNAPAGVYEMTVTVYNSDSETQVKKLISVGQAAGSTVVATSRIQDVSAGQTAEFDLIIVNTANSAKVFQVDTSSSNDLVVSAPSVVVVGAGSSETVTVQAAVPKGTAKGAYTFATEVEGKQVMFTANVVNGNGGSSSYSSTIGLTVVLIIVFVVLLAVLIILISRKDNNTVEEVETSYY